MVVYNIRKQEEGFSCVAHNNDTHVDLNIGHGCNEIEAIKDCISNDNQD